MKKILITGGTGFIGSNLSLKLLDKGYSIRVLDNLSPQIHGKEPEITSPLYSSIAGKVDFIHGSVTSKIDWIRAIEGMDAIIHLAAETGTGQSMYEVFRYSEVNSLGTALMLDVIANTKNTIEKIIVTSSRAIYGEGKYYCSNHGIVFPPSRCVRLLQQGFFECRCPLCNLEVVPKATDEESKINPTSMYGITKLTQEQMVMTLCPTLKIAPVVFRYQNVYGPGQSLSNPYTGILSIFSTRIKNGNPINIFEDGKESRDFIYIDDVVDATILGLESSKANAQIFNVGSGLPINVLTVAKLLVSTYNINVPINITGNFRSGDIRHNFADLSKISNLLGFKPKVNFKEGIAKFANWVNTQKISEDHFEKSLSELTKKRLFN